MIKDICKKYSIENWSLNSDGNVDVDGNVIYLTHKGLTRIPLKFGEVTGHFWCSNNRLIDLTGCPKRVGGDFNCSWNFLTTLKGAPQYISGDFTCRNNNIQNLEGFPRWVGGKVIIWNDSIKYIYDLIKDVYEADGGEWFSTSGNMIDLFNDLNPIIDNKIINEKRMNIFLESIGSYLTPMKINILEKGGWKIKK